MGQSRSVVSQLQVTFLLFYILGYLGVKPIMNKMFVISSVLSLDMMSSPDVDAISMSHDVASSLTLCLALSFFDDQKIYFSLARANIEGFFLFFFFLRLSAGL